ncbi:LytTR family transcriptional regulator DNA-binding domain-containing protein [Hymenobacter cellulosivorans]|uniref:LytTR family transcriptional regulator n=1 Tax=Hymenobacter cellulosivorans TaxID=2932249 RepID=A0ABY4F825_9BACT|nr:LytTR family transcriptional regulator DNA-binding domain-containing protein [Hymenobacter cellulosivorans]UOQ52351.1 LytTR family transcriptional regulator [Hymenobacter cellulosivorans]
MPLARELDYLRDYVSLQQLRYKSTPVVDLQITEETPTNTALPAWNRAPCKCGSFAKLEELLPAQHFARVHRSFLVAIDKIDHIEKNRIQIADHLIPISDTYAEAFYNMLKGCSRHHRPRYLSSSG